LKSTTARYDKDAVRWSLSWHPEGRCDSFTREAILANAPPASGVYGLFNFDCQVFIGESANIQEALLHHESETDFHSKHLRPTGFTFEACAAGLRKSKADALIARFRPMLQTKAALTETCSLSSGPLVNPVARRGNESETCADHQEFPVHEDEERPTSRRPFHINWTRGVSLVAVFVASALVIFYLGIPTDERNQPRTSDSGEAPARSAITKPSVLDGGAIGSTGRKLSSLHTAGGRMKPSAQPTSATPEPDGAARLFAKKASGKDAVDFQPLLQSAKDSPVRHATDNTELNKRWSVQVSAAPASDIASALAERIKANGYAGYVVQAEVKGQTFYRVRVGRFATREEAELVRESLALHDVYRDAFLTGD
jgi:cell division septation protein DedD